MSQILLGVQSKFEDTSTNKFFNMYNKQSNSDQININNENKFWTSDIIFSRKKESRVTTEQYTISLVQSNLIIKDKPRINR